MCIRDRQDIAQFDDQLRTEPTSLENYAPFDIGVGTPATTGRVLSQSPDNILIAAGLVTVIGGIIIVSGDDDDSPVSP